MFRNRTINEHWVGTFLKKVIFCGHLNTLENYINFENYIILGELANTIQDIEAIFTIVKILVSFFLFAKYIIKKMRLI